MLSSLPANDSNPNNYVSVRMNHSAFNVDPKK